MKILFLDIEVSPNVAHVWGVWQQNVALNQLMESSYVLCWAAKWEGEKTVQFDSVFQSRPKTMIQRIHRLISEADLVVHYNGTSFDMPTVAKECLLHEITPHAPVKELDLLKIVRRRFRFPSNKLDYVAQRLGLGKKVEHEGHLLWVKCMNKDAKAWKVMERYNRHDVVILERLYHRLLPWITTHANHGLLKRDGSMVCPNCGSGHYQRRGEAFTKTRSYRRFQCRSCGAWFRDANAEKTIRGRMVSL